MLADEDDGDRLRVRPELEERGRFDVVGEAANGDVAVYLAEARQPHLVLLALTIPTTEGLAALPRIVLAAPGTKVVLLAGSRS